MSAARKDKYDDAARYLNSKKRAQALADLAHQLLVVLDRRLPAKLNQVSDQPDGSLAYPAEPDQDLVGTIDTGNGPVDIRVERVKRGQATPIWLFASKTLAAIPDLYEEVNQLQPETVFPEFLVNTRFLNIPLFSWLALLVGLPLFYFTTALLNRVLGAFAGGAYRWLRRRKDLPNPGCLSGPVRLLLLAWLIHWGQSTVTLPLLTRVFWSSAAIILTITGCTWLVIRFNGWVERYINRRIELRSRAGTISLLRFGRRATDVLILFTGTLIALHTFGVNVGAALAGLGVGGIAVALAAQKSLENVIGGISLIFDKTVRVGSYLRVADTAGTVEEIGLRSIRLRTNDRTVVSVPNGQVANATLEDYSLRDKFWFHHIISLTYEATAAQIRAIIEETGSLLREHAAVDPDSVQLRLLRFGSSSLDVEVFAHFFAGDFNRFLTIQGELLLHIMELVQATGAQIALPSHTLHITDMRAPDQSEIYETPEADRKTWTRPGCRSDGPRANQESARGAPSIPA